MHIPRSLIQPASLLAHTREILPTCRSINVISHLCHGKKTAVKHDWSGMVMLIVGASKGIGSHIVRMSLQEGVKNVANLDIDDKRGLALQYELNQKFSDENKMKYLNCDVTNEQQLIECFQSVLSDKNKSYVVINNAGILNSSEEKSREEFDSSVAALVTGSLTALELMRKDRGGKGGAIINISPVSALCPLPLTPKHYSSRNAVLTFSLGLGNEAFYNRTGIRVMTVCYGGEAEKDIPYDEPENKYNSIIPRSYPEQKSAAQAVIDIFKYGESGSTWLSKENKPAEDISYVVKRAYSLIPEPK